MKQLVEAVLVLCFFFISTVSLAGQFGAPEPVAKFERLSLGIGSFYGQREWEPQDGNGARDLKFKSWQHYLQLSKAALMEGNQIETYIRIGGADLKVEDVFVTGQSSNDPNIQGFKSDFDADYQLFGTLGVKGTIYVSQHLAVGPFVQASIAEDYEDYTSGTVNGVQFTQKRKFKMPWDVNLGVMLQYSYKGFLAYTGPFLYWGRTDVEWTEPAPGTSVSGETTFEMKNVFGGVAGLRIPVVAGLNVEVEGQFTNEVSGGMNISYAF